MAVICEQNYRELDAFYRFVLRDIGADKLKLNFLQPVSSGVCVAVTEIIALGKRSGVARIDITNAGRSVCAAQGTVTVVGPRSGAS